MKKYMFVISVVRKPKGGETISNTTTVEYTPNVSILVNKRVSIGRAFNRNN